MNFPEGIRAFKPNEKAPEFVKANLLITGEFMEWFQKESSNGEVRLELLESKKGSYYLSKNEHKSSN